MAQHNLGVVGPKTLQGTIGQGGTADKENEHFKVTFELAAAICCRPSLPPFAAGHYRRWSHCWVTGRDHNAATSLHTEEALLC